MEKRFFTSARHAFFRVRNDALELLSPRRRPTMEEQAAKFNGRQIKKDTPPPRASRMLREVYDQRLEEAARENRDLHDGRWG